MIKYIQFDYDYSQLNNEFWQYKRRLKKFESTSTCMDITTGIKTTAEQKTWMAEISEGLSIEDIKNRRTYQMIELMSINE